MSILEFIVTVYVRKHPARLVSWNNTRNVVNIFDLYFLDKYWNKSTVCVFLVLDI